MLVIDNLLISEEIFSEEFVCNLGKCKGACCIAGDAGAPLNKDELKLLKDEYKNYAEFLTDEGRKAISAQGFSVYDSEDKNDKTPLIDGGPCAYIAYNDQGHATCGIESAYINNKTKFRKPISCHLYPIRESSVGNLTAVNYDVWDICTDACALGKELKVPVFKFLKDAIIRAYGAPTYEAMEAYFKNQIQK